MVGHPVVFSVIIGIVLSTVLSASEIPGAPKSEKHPRDEMPGNQRITWEKRRQVPYVRSGGVLNRKETAVVAYMDGDLFPPAVMASIQRGIFYWLTVGVDVGGNYGVFQALLRIKQEMARTRRTNFFFWGWHVRTGYKYVDVDLRDQISEEWRFDDNSWILSLENVFAFRFGSYRRRVIYISSQFYLDFDLRNENRQTDRYVFPATIGFETIIKDHWNFYFETGLIISLNGWETDQGVIKANGDTFPTASFGFAYRFGGVRTALPMDYRHSGSPPRR